MSHYPCASQQCPNFSRVLCYCCSKNYCQEHLKEHNDSYLSQLLELTDDVNKITEHFRGQCRLQLDQWRHQSHQAIESYYEKKCQELEKEIIPNENFKQNRLVIDWIKSKIDKLIHNQNITQQQIDSLRAATNAVRRELEQIPKEHYHLNITPLKLDDNFIQLDRTKINFNLQATIQSLDLTRNFSTNDSLVMTTSSKYLLVNSELNLCLYDKNLNFVKRIPWIHGSIWDMTMSNLLSKFILVSEYGIFTLDEQTMEIEKFECVTQQNTTWYCCACSEKSLFLAAQNVNIPINEYRLRKNEISLEMKHYCCTNNEFIEHMKCSKDFLGLIISNNETAQRYLSMRLISTGHQLWTISLNIKKELNIISCCSLNERGWLIVDLAQIRLIHVTNQGEIKKSVKYEAEPHCAALFDDDTLVILTEKGIHFHKIQ